MGPFGPWSSGCTGYRAASLVHIRYCLLQRSGNPTTWLSFRGHMVEQKRPMSIAWFVVVWGQVNWWPAVAVTPISKGLKKTPHILTEL